MSKGKTTVKLVRTVTVPRKDWEALVAFLRVHEEIYRDSYNTPGKDDWQEYFKESHPAEFEFYDDARRAASRRLR